MILQKLNHPNVIKYIDHVIKGSHVFLIMELHGSEWRPSMVAVNLCPNKHAFTTSATETVSSNQLSKQMSSCDLFECIDSHERIPEKQAKRIYAQIALVVDYLHQRDIVHRDLKDQNVVIDVRYKIKIINFGSSAYIPKQECDYFTKFNGTVNFASPEIAKNEPYRGPEAEMWAMGVLLYVMVFGEYPFCHAAKII
ncbi:kinase-like domain-containing protein [Chytriomyces sp. MP71]|nr:kinase-like domain-containing protein [Chytriomyces sp. MP71]